MEILKQSETQLILQHQPVFNWIIYWFGIISCLVVAPIIPKTYPEVGWLGYIPSLIGLFLIITTPSSNDVIIWKFDKSDNVLIVESKGFFRKKTDEYSLQEIHSLRVAKKTDELLVEIEVLLTQGKRLHLESLPYSVAKQEVNRISSFLQR